MTVALYSDFTNVSDIKTLDQIYDTSGECTFHDEDCPDGEDITTILGELEKARQTFEEYDNKTLTCYYDDDINYIFLEKEWNWGVTTGFLVAIGFFVVVIIIINVTYCCDKRRKVEKQKYQEEN